MEQIECNGHLERQTPEAVEAVGEVDNAVRVRAHQIHNLARAKYTQRHRVNCKRFAIYGSDKSSSQSHHYLEAIRKRQTSSKCLP